VWLSAVHLVQLDYFSWIDDTNTEVRKGVECDLHAACAWRGSSPGHVGSCELAVHCLLGQSSGREAEMQLERVGWTADERRRNALNGRLSEGRISHLLPERLRRGGGGFSFARVGFIWNEFDSEKLFFFCSNNMPFAECVMFWSLRQGTIVFVGVRPLLLSRCTSADEMSRCLQTMLSFVGDEVVMCFSNCYAFDV